VAGEPLIPLFRAPDSTAALPALQALLASGQLAGGATVAAFEIALGQFLGNPHVLAVSDRSAALTLALRAAGVRAGDDVLLSPLVCLATSMPVLNLGANPCWCDVDPATGMPTPSTLAARLTSRTRAIVLYHWGGDIGPITAVRAFADAHRLALIDDAAAAFGGEHRGRQLGNTGCDYTVLSFYAVNQLALGEGGALVCRRAADVDAIRWQRRYGIHVPSFRLADGDLNPASDIPQGGFNFGLTNLHAAIGVSQFDTLAQRLAMYRANGRFFDVALRDIPGLTLLTRADDSVSGYWVYGLRASRRATVLAALHAQGIGAQRLHLRNDLYSCFGSPQSPVPLPGVQRFDQENLVIPCGWWVDEAARARIVACLRDCA